MKLDKIGKQLRREATRSPKKAAILGLGTLVAIYFWVPLVWGWAGKKNMETVAVTVTSGANVPVVATATLSPVGGTPAAKPGVVARPSWEQLAQWMHADRRTKTAPRLALARDPFESAKGKAVVPTAEARAKTKAAPVAPSAAGLALTSTIIGPKGRAAQISGRVYSVGQTIPAADDRAGGAVFRLVEVQARRVVLEADGRQHELTLPDPGKSGKIEMIGALGQR